MRISDWSSDVCSSDLRYQNVGAFASEHLGGGAADPVTAAGDEDDLIFHVRHFCSLQLRVRRGGSAGRAAPACGRLVSLRRRRQPATDPRAAAAQRRSEEHTSELQSLMRISYAVFCLKKKKNHTPLTQHTNDTVTLTITHII